MESNEIRIRQARPEDLDAFYAISLATGEAGGDASHLYRDGRLIGHIYSAPYLLFSPETALVVEDGSGVAGYIVGAFDTAAFEDELELKWWPSLREKHPKPEGDPETWDADQRRAHLIHEPYRAPATLLDTYPAHIHMNLLTRLQGRGAGSALLRAWLDLARHSAIKGVHLGANARNENGIRFWMSRGFEPLTPPLIPADSRSAWFGQRL